MIYIREVEPIKMPGISSFMISFAFSQPTIDAIKTLPLYYYHRNTMSWEIPANDLAEALDALTFIDDIQLIMLPDETGMVSESTDLTDAEIKEFHFKPFAHQIDAINFGLQKKHKK